MTRKPDLTKEQAKEVRELYFQSRDKKSPSYWNVQMLAHSFDVSPAVINAAINRTGAYAED